MTTTIPVFRPRHIPPLLVATAMGIGALLPLWNARRAIREFGLPEHIATSPAAQACFTLYGSRSTCLGLAIWVFYLRGQLEAVDTILATMTYAGAVDAYICWREGVPRTALARAFAGLLIGGWGLLGLTSRASAA